MFASRRLARACFCQCRCYSTSTANAANPSSTTSEKWQLHDEYNAQIAVSSGIEFGDFIPDPVLQGLRVAVKDNFVTDSLDTTCASLMLMEYESPFNATVVDQLLENGAAIVAKANMDEFGMGSYGIHSCFADVRNPLDPQRVAGGSSAGSAASLFIDNCNAAIGSDTGGSVRLPASYTGIYGFKPSYGLLSRHGLVAYASSLDTVGIMAKKAEYVKRIFDALNVHDIRDPTSIPKKYRKKRSTVSSIPRLRIGVPQECFPAELSQTAVQPLRRALRLLRDKLDAEIVSVSIPSTPKALSAYYTIATAEASSNLARFDGVRYGGAPGRAPYAPTRTDAFGPEVQKRIMLGTYALTSDAFDNYFLAAQRLRLQLRAETDSVFRHINPLRPLSSKQAKDGVDILMYPSAISPAPTIEEAKKIEGGTGPYVQDILTVPASLAGIPAISCPVSVADSELPVGVQVVGQWSHDQLVLGIAQVLEESQK